MDRTAEMNPEHTGGAEVLNFAQALYTASSFEELERRLIAAIPRLIPAPMYGFYVLNPTTKGPERIASANVSDVFLARYEREGREIDAMHHQVLASGRVAYNMALMSMEEWVETPIFARVQSLHDIRYLIEAPTVHGGEVTGTLNIGTNDPHAGFTPYQVQLAEEVGRLVGVAIERIQTKARLEREHEQALLALELTGTAVVISDPLAPELRLNDAARRLMAQVVDRDERLHRVIARPGGEGGFSRHVEVELVDGGTGLIYGHSRPADRDGGTLITALELQREGSDIPEATLMALTPREREVALRVVDGLTDREIAARLSLSPHTVSQYVKRIYRKLDVDSRVALTRMLLELRHPQN